MRKKREQEQALIRQRMQRLRDQAAEAEVQVVQLEALLDRYQRQFQRSGNVAYAFLVDEEQRLTLDWLRGACEIITGYPADELVDLGGWYRFVVPEDEPLLQARWQALFAGRAYEQTLRIRTKQGAIRSIRDTAEPLFDPETGHLVRIEGTVEDVTQVEETLHDLQSQLEEKEKETRRLSKLVEANPAALVICDRTGRLLYVNPEAARLLEIPYGENVEYLSLWQFVEATSQMHLSGQLSRLREGEQEEDTTLWMLRQQHGGELQVASRAVGIRYEGREALLVAIYPDADDRAQRIRQLSEATLRAVFDSTLHAVLLVDQSFQIRALNEQAEALGRTVWGVALVPGDSVKVAVFPDDLEAFEAAFAKALAGQGQHFEAEIESPHVGRTWFEAIYQPVYDEQETAWGVCISLQDITAKKHTEAILWEAQARNQAMLDAIPDVMYRIGRDGAFLDYKAPASDPQALPPEQFLGRTVQEVFPGPIARDMMLAIEGALSGNQVFIFEYILDLGERGGLRDYEVRFAPVSHDEVVGIVRDITERKRADAELHLLKAAVAASADGLVISDARHGNNPLIYVNPGFEAMTGYTAEEALGRNCKFLQGEDRKQPSLKQVRRALDAEEGTRVVLRNYRKDGSQFWNELTLYPLRDDQGLLTHYVGVQHDVSERIRTEQALQFHAHLLDTIGHAIIATDLEDRVMYWNKGAEALYGLTAAEAAGRELNEAIRSDSNAIQMRNIMARLQRGQSWTGEMTITRDDGSTFPVQVTNTPVYDEEGGLMGVIGVSIDISDRHRDEATIARYAAQLQGLAQAALSIHGMVTLQDALQAIVDEARTVIDAHQAIIRVRMIEGGVLQAVSLSEKYDAWQNRSFERRLPHLTDYVRQAGRPARFTQDDVQRYVPEDERTDEHYPPLRGWLAAPLYDGVGAFLGVLELSDRAEGDFNQVDEAILVQLAQTASVAIEQVRLYEELEASRERLRSLSHKLVETQEAERHHIARELHDEIGQSLTVLRLALNVSFSLPKDLVREQLRNAQDQVDEIIKKVRELTLDLRPTMLDHLGLVPTLMWLFRRFEERTGIQVQFKHNVQDRRFSYEVETVTYRIIQEALTNVARHARTDRVKVQIRADREMLTAQVEDQGVGFDPALIVAPVKSSGLAGMKERAALMGGQLSVETMPGRGTTITLFLSIAEQPVAALPPAYQE